jgi:hypothetical protein
MRNIKIGDKLQVHCYKHDGTLHRVCEEATVLDITDEMLVCANYKTAISEKDGHSKYHKYRTKEAAILFFYKNEWFNIIGQMKDRGLYFYCNIASPYIIDDGLIKYIDYDLDLRVFPNGAFKVLDRNEYRFHKKKMNYSADLEKVIEYELSKLINLKKEGRTPFDKNTILYYYKIYEKMCSKPL